MGTWGTKLYQNDLALDIKDHFEEELKKGKSAEEITNELVEAYCDIMGDAGEEPIFWFALADTQWKWGRLQSYVKEQALKWIQNGGDLELWQDNSKKNILQRRKMMEELQEKLISPQPSQKKIAKRRLYKCQWEIGDVFAWQLKSDLAKEKGLFGRFLLIRKVDEGVWYPGHIVPIIYVKITKDDKLPATVEEYDQLEYIQTYSHTDVENYVVYKRFFFKEGDKIVEDKSKQLRIPYELDEYGYLCEYRIKILNTSKKIIPSNLIYLGNFKDAIPPQKEYIPHYEVELLTVPWKQFNKTFETIMLERYFLHNCRELSIYKVKME